MQPRRVHGGVEDHTSPTAPDVIFSHIVVKRKVMKEHLLIELEQDLLGKLVNEAKAKDQSISSFISSVLSMFFRAGGKIDLLAYPMRPVGTDLDGYLKGIERSEILRAIEQSESKSNAADLLGITFRSQRYRCSEHKIDT